LGRKAAAERLWVEERRAELVKEAQVHGAAGEHAVRAGIVQRQDRLRAMFGDHGREALVNRVEGFVPGDRLETALASSADAPERGPETALPVRDCREGARDPGADDIRRVRERLPA